MSTTDADREAAAAARRSEALQQWRAEYEATGEREAAFETVSSEPVAPMATPADVAGLDAERDIGLPGQFPFTRGPYASMYRTRLWTMRQFAGFGTARDTNQRYKFLLEKGQTGLSVAFDLPTLMGYDADHPRSAGEVGRCGVAISSLKDMETLFDGIRQSDVTTSMTINSPAAIIWAMYLVTGEKQGCRLDQLGGTTQNDILKEYIAQKEYIFPPEPSMRLVVDTIEFASRRVPRWHAVSISGYHIREAGSTAVQELAFTLADGFAYVEAAMQRGLEVDAFAPRLSFFFNSHIDFFEEIAKFRAARRIYARRMRDRYGATNPRSMMLRFHTQTAGCSLTAQQPLNNVVRTAWQALAGVLGGTQSLHTNSMDETLALPTEQAVKVALRTQQLIAEESGVDHRPPGGELVRRGPHQPYGAAGQRDLRAHRRAGRRHPGHREGLVPARDRQGRLQVPARAGGRPAGHRGRQQVRRRGGSVARGAQDRRGRRAGAATQPGRAAQRAQRRQGQGRPRSHPRRRALVRQPDAGVHGGLRGLLHAGRDGRRAARGVWDLS
jgi:methylmalonyl-CoA mutase cobalamin-binding domain/chain